MKRATFVAASTMAMLFAFSLQAAAADLVARIDVAKQTMTVSQYGQVMHVWPVSTARRGYVTPRGTWRPTRMHRMWHSRKYDNAPMPYAIFYHGGYAVHGTKEVRRLGRPASHGCVRLATPNAKAFFAMVKDVGPANTRITVVN
jgi:lipoprotein-anchoring transpeptidase ErfK/SrfK